MFTRARVEALSDAVFAISLTLLVLELRPPDAGRFAAALLDEWPVYLAYLTSFLTIALIWISHHSVFVRLKAVDAPIVLLNFGLLLGASLVPWPNALISSAVRSGERGDQTAAVIVYAVVTLIVAVPWALLNRRASRQPDLLVHPSAARWLRRNSLVAASSFLPAILGAGVAFVSPIVALVLFLALLLVSMIANLTSSYVRVPSDTNTDLDGDYQA